MAVNTLVADLSPAMGLTLYTQREVKLYMYKGSITIGCAMIFLEKKNKNLPILLHIIGPSLEITIFCLFCSERQAQRNKEVIFF